MWYAISYTNLALLDIKPNLISVTGWKDSSSKIHLLFSCLSMARALRVFSRATKPTVIIF